MSLQADELPSHEILQIKNATENIFLRLKDLPTQESFDDPMYTSVKAQRRLKQPAHFILQVETSLVLQ